jgi:radical SAM superfamily enzyme YgiQ (UPF0313 family)
MRILLVLPATEPLRVTHERPNVPDRAMLRFSILPLTTVAALTPPEHEVTLCDENVQALDTDADVDVVGVSFMTALAPRAYEIAAEFRARGKVVVAGGYHPTLCTEEAERHFDAVVVGEAEDLWPRVLADIAAGRTQRVYRHESAPSLCGAAIPRRDLTHDTMRHYVTVHAVQAGRGCPNRCRYCSVTAFFNHEHRTRPVADVVAELRGVPRDFMFVDDNLIADVDYARRLFEAIAPLGKRWVTQCSLSLADDPELMRLARAAGCRGVFVGLETLSAANLEELGKDINRAERYRKQIRTLRRAGIGVQAGVIVGLDADDTGVFERMLRFLQRARIDALQLNILTPLPGTPMYEQFDEAGRILDRDWSHYDFRHTVIRPAKMSPRELQDGADWLYHQYYRLDRVLLRTLRTLWTCGLVPAALTWRLSRTYRYDNRREGIRGRNPAPRRRSHARLLGEILEVAWRIFRPRHRART